MAARKEGFPMPGGTTLAIPNPPGRLNLFQKINEIRKETAAYVQKDSNVGFGNASYKAVRHDAVTESIRDSLIKFGVIVAATLNKSRVVDTTKVQGKNNHPIVRYEGNFDVTFIDCDNPQDRYVYNVDAHGEDSSDKAPGKAHSMATKYALLKIFTLITGEDEESRLTGEGTATTKAINEQQLADLRFKLASVEGDEEKFIANANSKLSTDFADLSQVTKGWVKHIDALLDHGIKVYNVRAAKAAAEEAK